MFRQKWIKNPRPLERIEPATPLWCLARHIYPTSPFHCIIIIYIIYNCNGGLFFPPRLCEREGIGWPLAGGLGRGDSRPRERALWTHSSVWSIAPVTRNRGGCWSVDWSTVYTYFHSSRFKRRKWAEWGMKDVFFQRRRKREIEKQTWLPLWQCVKSNPRDTPTRLTVRWVVALTPIRTEQGHLWVAYL